MGRKIKKILRKEKERWRRKSSLERTRQLKELIMKVKHPTNYLL